MAAVSRIGTPTGVRVTVTASVEKLCPVKREIDEGTVTITYRTGEESFELHSLADYLAGFKKLAISHEDFTLQLAAELHAKVTTAWWTAGMNVKCEDDRVLR